jgi:probable F420-dependent oxidoreductase
MDDVKFGINIPQFHPGDSSQLASLGKFAIEAEALGFDSLWTLDGVFREPPFLEPLSSLAYVAGLTKKVKLGTAVLLLPLRVPSIVAKETATIDFLSSGRVVLGAALGGGDKEYAASGVPITERVARFTEGLEIMRMLWTRSHVTYKGRFWDLNDVTITPRPTNPSGIPIWMGGSQIGQEVNEKAIVRAARLGDGWLGAGSTSLAASVRSFGTFVRYAREFGRDPDKLMIAKRVYVHVDREKKRARDVLDRNLLAFYRQPKDVESLCVFGAEEDCAMQLANLVRAGAKTLILHPVEDQLAQAELLADKVIPEVR